MKVRRKIRKALALFLALGMLFTVFAQDICITRAEESLTGDLEPSGSIGEENILREEHEVNSTKETKEDMAAGSGEERDEEFSEEIEESTKAGSNEERDEEFSEEMEESTKAGSGEESEEESEKEPSEKHQETEADNQEAVFVNEPLEVPEEGPKRISAGYFLADQPVTASEEISYPVYVSSPTISIEGSLNGSVQNMGIRQQKDLDQTAGGTVTSQHCPLYYTSCSYCKTDIYITAPFLYGAVYASVSDSSVIQRKEYISGEWADDSIIKDAGCLHVNYETKKPGTTDVKVYYYVRYQKHADAKGRCPLCRWLMPAVNSSTWYKYEDDFKIHVYADYSLRYDANAGTDSGRNMPEPLTERKAASAAEMEITDLKPLREGYQFLGWAERKDAVKETYTANDLITLRWREGADVEKTLYAVWKQNVQYGPVTEDIKYSKPNLTVIKRACRPDTVTPVTSVETGEAYSYVITIKNNAKSKIEHLQVSELLDTNLIQLLNNPADYKNGIWTIEHLEAGETVSLILHVKAIAESPAYENVVHVMAENAKQELAEIPPGPDDIRSATVEIRAIPDLTIQKEVDRQRACLGDTLTYTITVKNISETSKALDVRIRDQLPESLQWMGAFIQKDQEPIDTEENITVLKYMPEDGMYEVGDLGAGETATLTLMAKVLKADAGITNLASARKGTGPEVYDSAYTELIPLQHEKDPEEEEPLNPDPELPEEPEESDPEPSEELPPSSSDRRTENEERVPVQEPVLVSEREGDTVITAGTELPPVRPAAVELIAEKQPEAEEKTAVLKRKPEEAIAAEPDILADASDPRVPLAAHGHLCCILHLIIMLLTLIMELFYIRSMKKRQKRIFEIRKKLIENENRRREYA